MRAIRRVSIALSAAVTLPVSALLAQGRADVQGGAEYRSVSFGAGVGIASLKEFAVPLGFALPIGSRLSLDAGTFVVSAQSTDGSGASTTLNGLTDVIVHGAYQIKPDVAVLTFAVNVPTGQKTLSGQQQGIANAVATDLVPFPVTNFGSSFSVTTGLAYATPVGPWALGLAGSFRYTGSYQPISDSGFSTITIKPGAEIRMRLGADRIVGQGRLSLGVTYSTFSNNEIGSQTQSPGTRLIPQFSWSMPMGLNNSIAFYGWDVYRNVDESASVTGAVRQNTVALGAIASLRSGARNLLRPQLELRQGWQGPGGLKTQGTIVGLALRYQVVAGERMTLTPGVRVDLGRYANPGSSSSSVTGLSVSMIARTSF